MATSAQYCILPTNAFEHGARASFFFVYMRVESMEKMLTNAFLRRTLFSAEKQQIKHQIRNTYVEINVYLKTCEFFMFFKRFGLKLAITCKK